MSTTRTSRQLVAMVRAVYVDIRCPICKEYIANAEGGSHNFEINSMPQTVYCHNCKLDMPISKKVHGTFRTSK